MVRDNKPAGLEATVLAVSSKLMYAQELRADEVTKRFGPAGSNQPGWTVGDGTVWDRIGTTGHSTWLRSTSCATRPRSSPTACPLGTWQIRTTLRAETPGTFHGLPAIAEAMYVPEDPRQLDRVAHRSSEAPSPAPTRFRGGRAAPAPAVALGLGGARSPGLAPLAGPGPGKKRPGKDSGGRVRGSGAGHRAHRPPAAPP
ncbi:MAG: hypothetical protein R3F17_09955 [Planctomycetota bacterium]